MKGKLNSQSVLLAFLLLPLCASAETWHLNQIDIFGDLNFSDDFGDGLRNSPPTSSLIDQLGNTTEAGGALQFDSSDGGFLFSLPPFPDALRDQVIFNQPVADLISGGTTLQAHFQPMLTAIAVGSIADLYGIFITSFAGGAFLNVAQDFFGNPSVVYLDEMSNVIGIDAINLAGVTGDIVLDLSLDQSTDLVTPRYSIDGGVSFEEYGTWDFASGLIDVDYTPLFAGDFVALGAYGQTAVPIPAAVWFFASALGVVGWVGRKAA